MWSGAIVVHPWVGNNYQNPGYLLHKTLVLGESNFTESSNFKSDLVINCVLNDSSIDPSEERDTTGFCRFSTKIRRIVFGRDEAIGPSNFWLK